MEPVGRTGCAVNSQQDDEGLEGARWRGRPVRVDHATSRFGPSVRWSLFDGGRLRASVDAQSARARQAEIAWEGTVLVAVEEAENALTSFAREQERRSSLERAAAQSRRASEVARSQYTAGLTDLQAVLVSERATAGLEDDLAVSDAAVTSALVPLYKALGGGFEGAGEGVIVAAAVAGESARTTGSGASRSAMSLTPDTASTCPSPATGAGRRPAATLEWRQRLGPNRARRYCSGSVTEVAAAVGAPDGT
jgi:hypothetical protein